MFDFSHLPQNAVVSQFIGPSSGPSVWNKPPNARLVFMLAIGGGSGGGSGYFATSGGGGGGGGSGSITQALFLAHMIPSTLFVYFSGSSGRGSQSSLYSTAGANVQISNYGSNNPGNEAVFLRANGASYATSGGSSGGGTFGSGGGAVTSSTAALINHAIYFSSTAGRAGALGSQGSGGSVSIGTGIPIIGGAGGGGGGAAGGDFTSEIPFILPTISGGAGTTGEPGSNGVMLPFLFLGGTGGGSESTSGLGGVGGSAIGYGAGGGGGGSSPNYTPGGNGGPAYACIIAW